MPNLTFSVAWDRPPVIEMVVAVTRKRAGWLESRGRPVPRPEVVPALLDTGASTSLISQDIADQLKLHRGSKQVVSGIGGTVSVAGYLAMVQLLFPGIPPVSLKDSAEVIVVPNLNHLGARMILGRDVLSVCVLVYNGPHSTCTFAF